MSSKTQGFVALSSLKQAPPTADEALAAIRRIYFHTTARTIEHDLAHAIALLRSIEDEDVRDKAAVYMDGLAEMRGEWNRAARPSGGTRGTRPSTRAGKRPRPSKPKG